MAQNKECAEEGPHCSHLLHRTWFALVQAADAEDARGQYQYLLLGEKYGDFVKRGLSDCVEGQP